MKKFLLIIAIFTILIMGGILLAACDTQPEPPDELPTSVVPTLDKSSFAIMYSVDANGSANYELIWSAQNATSYKIKYDGLEAEAVTTEPKISLNETVWLYGWYHDDPVHGVAVTAIGEGNTKSETVEVNFKGTQLEMPINVRLYGDVNGLGWKGSDDTHAYALHCEELDLDLQTSKPVYTGNVKTTTVSENRCSLDLLRAVYNAHDLKPMQSFRVQALPYNGYFQRFDYTNDTDVMELQLPSDVSEQSVNLYAGEMSHPSNLRWDFTDFHFGSADVKWDGVDPTFKYEVSLQYPAGSFTAQITDKGASSGRVSFHYNMSGDYNVTVKSVCDEFNFIAEDEEAKSVTYSFFLPKPVTEVLKCSVNTITLAAPKNVRIEGDKIVWDEVENANNYHAVLTSGTHKINIPSFNTEAPLQEVFERSTYAGTVLEGDYDIAVVANAKSPELAGFDNNTPIINVYVSSADSEVKTRAIRIKSISPVRNVKVDYDTQTITWDEAPNAVSYSVGFYNNDFGRETLLGNTTKFKLDEDISQYSLVFVKAICEYTVIEEDGICTILAPSVYIVDIR